MQRVEFTYATEGSGWRPGLWSLSCSNVNFFGRMCTDLIKYKISYAFTYRKIASSISFVSSFQVSWDKTVK